MREEAAEVHGEGRIALMTSPEFTSYVFASRHGPSGIYLAPPTCYCIGRKLSHRSLDATAVGGGLYVSGRTTRPSE